MAIMRLTQEREVEVVTKKKVLETIDVECLDLTKKSQHTVEVMVEVLSYKDKPAGEAARQVYVDGVLWVGAKVTGWSGAGSWPRIDEEGVPTSLVRVDFPGGVVEFTNAILMRSDARHFPRTTTATATAVDRKCTCSTILSSACNCCKAKVGEPCKHSF